MNPLISNPLIDETSVSTTVANATEALDAVLCLLAESKDQKYRHLFVMLQPVIHALTYATEEGSV